MGQRGATLKLPDKICKKISRDEESQPRQEGAVASHAGSRIARDPKVLVANARDRSG